MGHSSRGQGREVYHLNNGAVVVQVLGRGVPLPRLHAHQRLATKRRHERADLQTGKFWHSRRKVRSLLNIECEKQKPNVEHTARRGEPEHMSIFDLPNSQSVSTVAATALSASQFHAAGSRTSGLAS